MTFPTPLTLLGVAFVLLLLPPPVASASYWSADYEFGSGPSATARFEYVYHGADAARVRGGADIDRDGLVGQQERAFVEAQLREQLSKASFEYLDGEPALERRPLALRMYELEGPVYEAQPRPVEIRSAFELPFKWREQASHEFLVNVTYLPNGSVDFTAPVGQRIAAVEGLDPKREKGERDVEGTYASTPLRILLKDQTPEALPGLPPGLPLFVLAIVVAAFSRRRHTGRP